MGALRFRSAADAFAEAQRMEELRDDDVKALRDAGREAAADRASDKWARQIEEAQAEGRRLEAAEAKKTRQPRDTPRQPSRRSPRTRRTSPASSSARSSSTLGRVARSGYRRSGAQAQVTGWGTLAWQLAGMTIGIAILTIFISSSRGTGAFAALANGLAGGLKLLVGQVDPLAQGAVATTVEGAPATSSGSVTAPGQAQVPKPGGRVLVGKA